MSSKRRRGDHGEEHENHERWAVSYADMMTVLVALFIVLYAMSTVDQTKFEELRQSLAAGFGNDSVNVTQGTMGALDGVESFAIAPDFTAVASGAESEPDIAEGDGATSYEEALEEYASLEEIREQIAARLAQDGLEMYVQFQIDERGLVVGLIGPQVFFGADDASLTDLAALLIDDLSGPLRDQPRSLSIEGHANSLPSSNYATNWELSSARSTQVLRRMVESGGIDPASIGATGYGDARPAASGESAEALAANRRVDVVVVPNVSDDVKALLPEIAQAVADGAISLDDLRARASSPANNEGDPT